MDDTSLSAEERAAVKEHVAELRAAKARGKGAAKAAAELADCEAKIAEMPEVDRVIAAALHEIVRTHAPELAPKTWYGMPAYARDGKVVVFFKPSVKFKVRYAEVGFNEHADLDDGDMWPTVFAVLTVTEQITSELTRLVLRASGPSKP